MIERKNTNRTSATYGSTVCKFQDPSLSSLIKIYVPMSLPENQTLEVEWKKELQFHDLQALIPQVTDPWIQHGRKRVSPPTLYYLCSWIKCCKLLQNHSLFLNHFGYVAGSPFILKSWFIVQKSGSLSPSTVTPFGSLYPGLCMFQPPIQVGFD